MTRDGPLSARDQSGRKTDVRSPTTEGPGSDSIPSSAAASDNRWNFDADRLRSREVDDQIESYY